MYRACVLLVVIIMIIERQKAEKTLLNIVKQTTTDTQDKTFADNSHGLPLIICVNDIREM